MNIIALNSPFYSRYSRSQRSPTVTKSGAIYNPLWLAYATGVLEQDGLSVRLIDAPATGLDREHVLEIVEETVSLSTLWQVILHPEESCLISRAGRTFAQYLSRPSPSDAAYVSYIS